MSATAPTLGRFSHLKDARESLRLAGVPDNLASAAMSAIVSSL